MRSIALHPPQTSPFNSPIVPDSSSVPIYNPGQGGAMQQKSNTPPPPTVSNRSYMQAKVYSVSKARLYQLISLIFSPINRLLANLLSSKGKAAPPTWEGFDQYTVSTLKQWGNLDQPGSRIFLESSFYTVKLLFCKGLIPCPVATFLQLKTRTMERNEERKFRKDNAPENCMFHMNTFGPQMSLCFLICV